MAETNGHPSITLDINDLNSPNNKIYLWGHGRSQPGATVMNKYVMARWKREKQSGTCALERGGTGDMTVVTGVREG